MKITAGKLFLLSALILVTLGACASFEGPIPIESQLSEAYYISPKNGDGIQDSLEIEVDFPPMPGLVISSYEFSILRDNGSVVYSEAASAAKVSPIKRLFGARSTIPLPKVLSWDGRDSAGKLVDDAAYYLTASASDASGNSGSLPLIPVIVDDTYPAANLQLPYTIVSPNGDGNQDILDIYFSGATNELHWKGVIESADGIEITSREWSGVPREFQWDGLGADGSQVPDGQYSFIISATDQAGNAFLKESSPIIKDSSLPPIRAYLSGLIISPNGDGVMDTVVLTLEAENADQIKSASLTIIDQDGTQLASLPGPVSYPHRSTLDGLQTNGRPFPDGNYYFRFEAQYLNGAKPSVITSALKIDNLPPYAVVGAAQRVFSPDGDGRLDTFALYQSTDEAVSWTGTLSTPAGSTVFIRDWGTRAVSIDWDGLGSDGQIVADGTYIYTLRGIDEAGNVTTRIIDNIRLDTRPTPVELQLLDAGFSPNDDGIAETARFTPVVQINEGVIAWFFEVVNDDEETFYSLAGENLAELPFTIPWKGLNAPEGLYSGKLRVEYEKGNITESRSPEKVALDLTGPVITPQLTPQPFSPDGDGVNDRLSVVITLNDPAGIASSSARILDPAGNVFINVPAAAFGAAGWSWDGKSASGELVQSASEYTLEVSAIDQLGNKNNASQAVPIDILVIRDGDRLWISISSIIFKPNTADYLNVDTELAKRNLATLDRLAEILENYGAYRILLEGHAVRVYWNRPALWQSEETEELVPLSRNRAEAIRAALATRGIRSDRMSTEGFGGYKPIVPHGDLSNRWKNRRVEFVLVK